jgi:hypothetical protein
VVEEVVEAVVKVMVELVGSSGRRDEEVEFAGKKMIF